MGRSQRPYLERDLFRGKAKAAPPPKRRQPDYHEVAVGHVLDKYSNYPSNGLTPEKLAEIFRAADAGDVLLQMELFEEMEEKDPHLFSQLQTRKNAVTGLDFEIIPFDPDNDRDKEIAEFVASEISGLEHLEDVMMDLLDAIGKGIAVSEIIWDYAGGGIRVADIRSRHQKRFFWDVEDQFKVYTRDTPEGLIIPENKFIIHRYKARSGHPSRAGILRVIAWMYLFKNYDLKDWVSFCEVYGMPLRLGTYAQGASEEDKAALMRALVQIGTDAAGMIPDGTTIEFKESAKTSSADIYEKLARYCDEQMSKAVLGQTLTSDSGGGSYAQSKTHNEVRHDLTVADCKALAATLRRDLIRPLVLFNFSEERRIPNVRFDCEEGEDLKEHAELVGTLIEKTGLEVSTAYLYKKFGIPKPEQGEEIAKPRPRSSFPISMKAGPWTGTVRREAVPAAGHGTQERIDQVVSIATKRSDPLFAKMFEPIREFLDGGASLQEMKDRLQDPEFVRAIYAKMDARDFETLLQRSMMIADLEGRVATDG